MLEAAALDGCGQVRLAWNIKLPQIRRYAVLIVVLSFATGTQVFVEPTILYQRGRGFRQPNLVAQRVELLLRLYVREVRR